MDTPTGVSETREPMWRSSLRAALPAWIVARVLAVATFLIVRTITRAHTITHDGRRVRIPASLVIGDGTWYRDIAHYGYRGLPREATRFFPLLPEFTRLVHRSGIPVGVSLLLITNVAALVAAMLLYRLVRIELGDDTTARLAAVLVALQPLGFVLVFGYSEALFLVLSITVLLTLRREQLVPAAVAAYFAGLTRPTGAIIAIAAAIEVARNWRGWNVRQRVLGIVATAAAPAGTLTYLAWVRDAFGDAKLPFRVQESGRLRGPVTNPFHALGHAIGDVATHGRTNVAVHLIWIVIVLALLVVCARRLPASYTAFAAVTIFAALTSTNLDSFERYVLGTFPVTIAAASVLARSRWRNPVIVGSCVAFVGYEALALVARYVP